MWLYVPKKIRSLSSTSARERECSESPSSSPSNQSDCEVKLWVMLSGIAVQRPLSWRGWNRRAHVRLLSGAMLNQSTLNSGVVAWTSSLRATRANHFHNPASVVGKAILDTFGRQSVERLRELNPASCSWKTSRGTFPWVSTSSSRNWKDWATRLRRDCLARRKSALATGGNDCSSWQTPKTTAGGWLNQPDGSTKLTLAGEAENWGTPAAADAVTPNAGGQMKSLRTDIQQWATPTAKHGGADNERGKRKKGGDSDLRKQSQAFPVTPQPETTTELGPLQSQLDRIWLQRCKSSAAMMLKPLYGERCGVACPGVTGANDERWLLLLQDKLSQRLSQRRLNPNFAEWLMGWPVALTACDLSETGLIPWWRLTLLSLCRLVCLNDREVN